MNASTTQILARMAETQGIIDSLNNRRQDTTSQVILDSIDSRLAIYRDSMLELSSQLLKSIN